MPLAVHLLVLQEDAVLGPGAHEVVVAGAGGEAAAHSGARLLAEFTSLTMQSKHGPCQTLKHFKPFPTSPSWSFLEVILFIDNLLNHREGI